MSTWMDRFGSAASLACALHCGLFAFAPAIVAVLGLQSLGNEVVEWGLFSCALLFAGMAGATGYRAHQHRHIALGFVGGACALVVARLSEAYELTEYGPVFAILGGLVLVSAHLANIRACRACHEDCHP